MYAELDRFLVPLDLPAARAYFNEALYVPQGIGGRLRRAIGRPGLRRASTTEGIAHALTMLEEAPGAALPQTSPIYLRDYADSDRGRTIAFFFQSTDRQPCLIAKTQHRLEHGPSLRAESEALEQMRAFLPPELRSTIPKVIGFHSTPRGELLLMTALSGRSAYIDMQGALAPWRYVEEHFDAAARWLAEFHLATRSSSSSRVGGVTVPHSAGHGDYWPRNVLLADPGAVGVVDWEHFMTAASPLTDLLHYATTYGLNYPWKGYHRAPEAIALRRTYFEDNRVSRAVRRYLRLYVERTGIPQAAVDAAIAAVCKGR